MEIWLPATFLVVAVLGSAAYAAARGWRLWRTFRRSSGRATEALGRVSDSAADAERRATALTAKTEGLATATARLQEALAELAVLRDAAAEARATVDAVRGLVPTK